MGGKIRLELKIENVNVGHGNNTGLIFQGRNDLKSVLYQDVIILQL